MIMGLENKLHHLDVGLRTGKNVLEGKIVSKKSDGLENFSDYWTEADSVLSDETTTNNSELTQSSTSVSDQESDSTCPIIPTGKKAIDTKREVFHNYRYNPKEQILQNCKVVLFRNREIDIIARSNKILPSCLLNEISLSENITSSKKIKEKCLFDSEKISSIQKSSEVLSNASENKMGGLPISIDNANSKSTSSYKTNPGIKSKTVNDFSMEEENVLPSNEKSYTLSNLKKTRGKEIHAPHNMRKSQILLKASSLANNKGKVIKRNSEVKSSQGVVFDHREKIFLKNNRTLNNSERENAIKLNIQNSSTAKSLVATKRNTKALDTLKDKSSKFIDIENSSGKANGRSSLGKRSILPVAELKFGNESDSRLSEGEISPLEEKTSKIPSSVKETQGEKRNSIYHLRNSSIMTEYSRFFSDPSSIEEVEVLSSEEKANKISSSFKETEGEKIAPVYHTRNSSKRQSPQVLCDTSSVSNYSKSVSRRNSGGASTQDEMPNLMDASNNLRCSPHNFPFIKCSTDKGNKQNSHRRSTQPVVLSSEELSEEGITLFRNNSAPEILSSDEEETDNSSSIEKSPRVSEYSMTQVNGSPTSCVKTAKPMLSEGSNSFLSETKKDNFLKKKEATSCYVRRSTRTRFPPLASWRNERLKFVKSGSEDKQYLSLDEGRPEDNYAYRSLTKRLCRRKNFKSKVSYKNGTSRIKKTTVSLVNTGEKVKEQLHFPFNACQFTMPKTESGNFTMCKQFSSNLVNLGFINIPAHGMKDVQVPCDSNMHFLVIKGTVDAAIAKSSYTFSQWDSFVVPMDNGYSLSNNGPSSALLYYCRSKSPFFKYQKFPR